ASTVVPSRPLEPVRRAEKAAGADPKGDRRQAGEDPHRRTEETAPRAAWRTRWRWSGRRPWRTRWLRRLPPAWTDPAAACSGALEPDCRSEKTARRAAKGRRQQARQAPER